jgi:hypothetical protein
MRDFFLFEPKFAECCGLLKVNEECFYIDDIYIVTVAKCTSCLRISVSLCPLFQAYWAGGLHLFTPLPFRPGKGGFGDLFRMHIFLNAGNLGDVYLGKTDICS